MRYKVLIVDDEYLVRELIKRSLPWEELDCTITGEASGGREALDLVEEVVPDIVITDICMPIMDGIKLSSLILERHPQIKIVVLTGHNEFVYAKESVSIGIKEYLLKPINPNELKETVIRVSKEIDRERDIEENLNLALPYIREKLLNTLLTSDTINREIEDSIKKYGIEFSSTFFQVAVIKILSGSKDFYSSRELIVKNIEQYFLNDKNIVCFIGFRGNIIILSNDENSDLELLVNRIISNISSMHNRSFTAGLGQRVIGLQSISRSYDQAIKALEFYVVEGENSVISFDDVETVKRFDSSKYTKNIRELNFSIKAGLKDKLLKTVKDLFKLQVDGVGKDIGSIRIMASNILSEIISIINEQGIEVDKVFINENQPYERIYEEKSLIDLSSYIYTVGERVMTIIRTNNSQTSSKLIHSVKIYLKENLSNPDLQLSSVAEEFNVNSSYLSRKFKVESGETFIEFLASLRIERAIELLNSSDKRSYEIADEIGISDPHYFSIFFKKKMNMSISEYKKKIRVE